jgi:hypothetical protein
VRARITRAAARAGRDASEITLIGVTKLVPAERVVLGVRAGLRDLGENYVQEADAKLPAVREALAARAETPPALRWHAIGRLQRNKARDVARLFDAVHSVDRIELARELDRRAGEASRRLAVFFQVNLCAEPQKGGAAPNAVPALVAACAELAHLDPTGLMVVPADDPDPEAARPAFAALRELAGELRARPGGERLRHLSMGMSHDFEVAIEEGATHVRVGTALFGPRGGTA